MRSDRGNGRVSEVVGGDIDPLDLGDRNSTDRHKAFLKSSYFTRQGGLVADSGRQAAEQTRYLRSRLDKSKNVVHQQKDVLVALVAEIFSDGKRSQRHAPARTRRFVHLSIDEHGTLENARRAHVEQH